MKLLVTVYQTQVSELMCSTSFINNVLGIYLMFNEDCYPNGSYINYIYKTPGHINYSPLQCNVMRVRLFTILIMQLFIILLLLGMQRELVVEYLGSQTIMVIMYIGVRDIKTTIGFPFILLINKRFHQCFVHKYIICHTKMEVDQLILSLVKTMM